MAVVQIFNIVVLYSGSVWALLPEMVLVVLGGIAEVRVNRKKVEFIFEIYR